MGRRNLPISNTEGEDSDEWGCKKIDGDKEHGRGTVVPGAGNREEMETRTKVLGLGRLGLPRQRDWGKDLEGKNEMGQGAL